jgi:hypothetical protein
MLAPRGSVPGLNALGLAGGVSRRRTSRHELEFARGERVEAEAAVLGALCARRAQAARGEQADVGDRLLLWTDAAAAYRHGCRQAQLNLDLGNAGRKLDHLTQRDKGRLVRCVVRGRSDEPCSRLQAGEGEAPARVGPGAPQVGVAELEEARRRASDDPNQPASSRDAFGVEQDAAQRATEVNAEVALTNLARREP